MLHFKAKLIVKKLEFPGKKNGKQERTEIGKLKYYCLENKTEKKLVFFSMFKSRRIFQGEFELYLCMSNSISCVKEDGWEGRLTHLSAFPAEKRRVSNIRPVSRDTIGGVFGGILKGQQRGHQTMLYHRKGYPIFLPLVPSQLLLISYFLFGR